MVCPGGHWPTTNILLLPACLSNPYFSKTFTLNTLIKLYHNNCVYVHIPVFNQMDKISSSKELRVLMVLTRRCATSRVCCQRSVSSDGWIPPRACMTIALQTWLDCCVHVCPMDRTNWSKWAMCGHTLSYSALCTVSRHLLSISTPEREKPVQCIFNSGLVLKDFTVQPLPLWRLVKYLVLC